MLASSLSFQALLVFQCHLEVTATHFGTSRRQVKRLCVGKRIAGKINAEYDVAGLCCELPARVAELERRGGGKLAK